LYGKRTRTPFTLRLELDYYGNLKEAVRAIAVEMGMAHEQQALRIAIDMSSGDRIDLAFSYYAGGE